MPAALPWLIVLAADAAVIASSPLYVSLVSRTAGGGLFLPTFFQSYGAGGWQVAGNVCSIVVLLILHPAVAALAVRPAAQAPHPARFVSARFVTAAAPVLAFGPLVGLLAGLSAAAPAAVAPDPLNFYGDQLRGIAIERLAGGAFWGTMAGMAAAAALLVAAMATEIWRPDDEAPAEQRADEPEADDDEELAQLWGLARRAVAIGGAGVVVAVLLLLVLSSPAVVESAGRGVESILAALDWTVTASSGQHMPEDYLPLATVPAYLLALLVALPVAALTMGPAAPPLQRLSRAWIGVGAAVAAQATMAGLVHGGLAIARTPQDIGGSWMRGYATIGARWVAELPEAAAYVALVGWIPAAAMTAVSWRLDRHPAAAIVTPTPRS